MPGTLSRRALLAAAAARAGAAPAHPENWYERSFYLLHLDHHTSGDSAVGRDADPAETARLLALSKPDVIQIHAKGRPGWTTYPSSIGHTPAKLARDVLNVWTGIARRDGYRMSVYYNLGRDGVIMNRRPEWNRVKANGEPWEHALCYHSGVTEQYLWPMIDEIQERYRPDGFWFDGSCFTVTVCYCGKCRERFRREHGMPPPESARDKGWAEFKEMQRRIYRDFLRDTVARVKRRDPGCLVAVNWAWSHIMPEAADHVDYLTGDRASNVDMLAWDAHWYDGQGKPFDLMTTVFINDGGQRVVKSVEQMQQELAIIVANGGRYFAWDNPSPASGLVEERQRFLGEAVAPFLRARQRWCRQTERVPDAAILNSAADHYAATLNSPVCFAMSPDRVRGPAEALRRQHLNYEVVSSARLLAGDIRARLLVVDDPMALAPAEIDALRRWRGTLLVTGKRFHDAFRSPQVVRAEMALADHSSETLTALLESALPPARRHVTTTAAPEVEVILRRAGPRSVLHLVNCAPGRRTRLPGKPGSAVQRITDIPPAAPCTVSVRAAKKPSSVTLQPEGTALRRWTYKSGRIEAQIPEFAIHQMVVFET